MYNQCIPKFLWDRPFVPDVLKEMSQLGDEIVLGSVIVLGFVYSVHTQTALCRADKTFLVFYLAQRGEENMYLYFTKAW